MFQDEGHFAGAHFQHAPRTGGLTGGVAETRIEEARIMDAKLADQRIEGHHLGGMVGRDRHLLAADQDVELVRVQHHVAPRVGLDRFPEVGRVEHANLVHIDEPGVLLGAEADALARIRAALEVDGKRQAIVDIGFARYQRHLFVQTAQRGIARLGRAVADAQLVQP